MSRSHANPPRTQDQQGDLDSRLPRDALETLQANADEMEIEVEKLARPGGLARSTPN